jgi:hypothetical protein
VQTRLTYDPNSRHYPWLPEEGQDVIQRRWWPDPIYTTDHPYLACNRGNPLAKSVPKLYARIRAGQNVSVSYLAPECPFEPPVPFPTVPSVPGYGEQNPPMRCAGPGYRWPHHTGPLMVYMAECRGPCEEFDGSGKRVSVARCLQFPFFGATSGAQRVGRFSRAVVHVAFANVSWESLDLVAGRVSFKATHANTVLQWFKIAEAGHNPDGWGTKYGDKASIASSWGWAQSSFIENGWSVTIPKNLKPGKYLIRHEAVNLDASLQFYPECANLEVVGEGTQLPTEEYLAEFPGAYSPDEPAFIFAGNLYGPEGHSTYVSY